MSKTFSWALLAVFLVLFSAQGIYQASTNSTVSDEVAHLGAGYSYLKFHDYRLNPEHPPFAKQLGALPLLFMDLKFAHGSPEWQQAEQWWLGRSFMYTLGNPAGKMLFAARSMIVLLGILFAVFLFWAVQKYWGTAAGLAAVFFYALSPEIIAHSALVNTDFAGACFFFIFFFLLHRAFETGSAKTLVLAGLSAGFALISKFSMVQILPLLYLFSFVLAFWGHSGLPQVKFSWWALAMITGIIVLHKMTAIIFAAPLLFCWGLALKPGLKIFSNVKINKAASILLLLLCLAFLVVALAYVEPAFWVHKFRPFKRFFRGWAIFKDHAKNLQHPGYLLGEISNHGWRYYYLMAMLVKIPAPILIFGFWGIYAALKNKDLTKWQWLFYVLPCGLFFFIASFINKVNIGLRHVLPLYPFFLLFATLGFKSLVRSAAGKLAAAALSVWLIASIALAFPNYLSYFNETSVLFGGKEKILSDSNISWGQDIRRLKKYTEENNIGQIKTLLLFNFSEELDYYKLPWTEGNADFAKRAPGVYAVDIFNYQRLIMHHEYAWLLSQKPEKVGGSILIYRL